VESRIFMTGAERWQSAESESSMDQCDSTAVREQGGVERLDGGRKVGVREIRADQSHQKKEEKKFVVKKKNQRRSRLSLQKEWD